eukprot:TRINITY_DN2454_c0_g1_i4.p1 TRINITY_DN2454_c0_g1~~TRINITY_DN2454_c0_g1_i4.p1  ORF type:complete len:353 (+),score=40.91 TRINITY_DN2454_c0_g1_i4:256-1314(+)
MKGTLNDYFSFNVWPLFSPRSLVDFSQDSGRSFYMLYGKAFSDIRQRELLAFQKFSKLEVEDENLEDNDCFDWVELPEFGDSSTSENTIREFYEKWSNFRTFQTYAGFERHKLAKKCTAFRARDIVEREILKTKLEEGREYIDVLFQLLHYVRRRDPRLFGGRKASSGEDCGNQKEFGIMERRNSKVNELYALPDHYCETCLKEFKCLNQLLNHYKSVAHKRVLRKLLDNSKETAEKNFILELQGRAKKIIDAHAFNVIVVSKEEEAKSKTRKKKKEGAKDREVEEEFLREKREAEQFVMETFFDEKQYEEFNIAFSELIELDGRLRPKGIGPRRGRTSKFFVSYGAEDDLF